MYDLIGCLFLLLVGMLAGGLLVHKFGARFSKALDAVEVEAKAVDENASKVLAAATAAVAAAKG